MAISDSITKLIADITSAYNTIAQKGGTIPSEKNTDNLSDAIESIPTKETVTWHQCPQAVKDFLENVTYDPSDYSYSEIENYAPATPLTSNTKPIGKAVDDKTFYNEVPNQKTPFSATNLAGTVEPLDQLRWLNTSASNVRDLGGWDCDGGTVNYGKLIRGGEISSADRDVLVHQAGIRRELNLRGSETDNTVSPLGDEIYFFRPQSFSPYTLNNAYMPDILRYVIEAVIHNEPVYFHCYAGADRTGTLAFILEALLGVSQSDIDKDYELTMFHTNTISRTRNNTSFYKKLIDDVEALSGDTLRNKLIIYALSKGITVSELNKFRSMMIDGNPDILCGITNNLTHCTTNNNQQIVFSGGYTATITADSGYTLTGAEVSVTMGGVDITSTAYSNGTINIADVTGEIEISVVAVADVPIYTNQVPISTDENGNIYNGTGYKDGYRLDGKATEAASTGSILTGFIPVKAGDVVRFSGVYLGTGGGSENSFFFDTNKSNYSHRMTPYNWKEKINVAEFEPYEYDDATHILSSFTVPNDTSIAYVRFSLHGTTGADAIITVNEII